MRDSILFFKLLIWGFKNRITHKNITMAWQAARRKNNILSKILHACPSTYPLIPSDRDMYVFYVTAHAIGSQ